MGFYGNMSSVTKASFQFDKIYPNRHEMDLNASNDGVFVGRYVLVDYDRSDDISQIVDPKKSDISDEIAQIIKEHNLIPAYMVIRETEAGNILTFHTGKSFSSPRFVISTTDENNFTSITEGSYILVLGKINISTIGKSYGYYYNQQQVIDITQSERYKSIIPEVWYCTRGENPITTVDLDNVPQEISFAAFERVGLVYPQDEDGVVNNYQSNYSIDNKYYDNIGRGWDSTAWQKVIKTTVDNKGNPVTVAGYVMIAELNSVVPTFDIAADAPTETPIPPHFDTDSSNVYYKLHIQPSWSFRLKSRYNIYTTDSLIYPSDVDGSFVIDTKLNRGAVQKYIATYRKKTDDSSQYESGPFDGRAIYPQQINLDENDSINFTSLDEDQRMPLAIYFNKNGFKPFVGSDAETDVRAKGGSLETILVKNDNDFATDLKGKHILKDSIMITPTGLSGNEYNHHFGGKDLLKKQLPDTYELSIMLPSLGNTISSVWDLVYGPSVVHDANNRTLWDPETGHFAVDEDNQRIRNGNIFWNSHNGLRMITERPDETYSFNKSATSTMAGMINSAHDLMGMIILDFNKWEVTELGRDENNNIVPKTHIESLWDLNNHFEDWDPTKIYYVNNKYWYKRKTYSYTPSAINYRAVSSKDLIDLSSGKYYREEICEFPVLETEENQTYSELGYTNYRRITNPDDLIEGANYCTFKDEESISVLETVDYEPGRYYYINNQIPRTFTLGTELTPLRGKVYYEIEPVQLEGFEFYVPNRYYVKEPSGKIRLCTEKTLSAIIGATDTEGSEYKFYKNTQVDTTILNPDDPEDGTEVRYEKKIRVDEHGNPILLKVAVETPDKAINFSLNENWVNAQNTDIILTILQDDGTTVIDRIAKENVHFSNNEPDYYYTNRYLISGSAEVYASPWEAYKNSYAFKLDEERQLIPEYVYDLVEIDPQDAYIVDLGQLIRLKEFISSEQSPTYYFKNTNMYQAETIRDLNTGQGLSRNVLDSNGKLSYYTIEVDDSNKKLPFYSLSGCYYYKNQKGDILRETLEKSSVYDEIEYINPRVATRIDYNNIFQEGKFFKDTNFTQPVTQEELASLDQIVYEKIGTYVVSDTRNIYKQGAIWNENVPVPEGVIVGVKNTVWEKAELKDLGIRENTMNGLILHVNRLLAEGDEKTRDSSTFQGVINKFNDIVDKFNILNPQEFVTINRYGQVHSSGWDSDQSGSYKNYGTNLTTNYPVAEDSQRWISLDLDDDVNGPHFTIKHEYNQVTSTTTVADKNGGNISGVAGLNNNENDTLKLYTPIVDNMGHVVGENFETVTLPYNYKTVTIGAQSETVYDSTKNNLVAGSTIDKSYSGTGNLIAENIKDTFTVNTGNKWIRLVPDIVNKSFQISHEVHNINVSNNNPTNLNSDGGSDTIVISDWDFDNAGHIIEKHDHEYTLPYGYKFVQDEGNNSIQAGNTQDKLIVVGDSYLTTSVNDHTLTISHDKVNPTTAATQLIENVTTPAFGSTFVINDYSFDSQGHRIVTSSHTVQFPEGKIAYGEHDETSANVITSLAFDPASGKITKTDANVGTLPLTGYSQSQSISAMPESIDSINVAISKLSYVLNNSTVTVNERIEALDVSETTGDFIAKIKQENGKIIATSGTFGTTNTISANSWNEDRSVITSISINSSGQIDGNKVQLGSAALSDTTDFDSAGAANNVQTALIGENSDTYESNTIIGAKKYTDNAFSKSYGDINETQYTIEEMVAKINELESRLSALEPTPEP